MDNKKAHKIHSIKFLAAHGLTIKRKTCPKCGTHKIEQDTECPKCGRYMGRYKLWKEINRNKGIRDARKKQNTKKSKKRSV